MNYVYKIKWDLEAPWCIGSKEETVSFSVLQKFSECPHPKISWIRRAHNITASISFSFRRGRRILSGVVRGSGRK